MHHEKLRVQAALPELKVMVTAKAIIMGATASRDWQPQHHDTAWAVRAGLPGIIMNNYTQAGWISRYVTDFTGVQGRLRRMRIVMRQPICPGDELALNGVIQSVEAVDETVWALIAIELTVRGRIVTASEVQVGMPAAASLPLL